MAGEPQASLDSQGVAAALSWEPGGHARIGLRLAIGGGAVLVCLLAVGSGAAAPDYFPEDMPSPGVKRDNSVMEASVMPWASHAGAVWVAQACDRGPAAAGARLAWHAWRVGTASLISRTAAGAVAGVMDARCTASKTTADLAPVPGLPLGEVVMPGIAALLSTRRRRHELGVQSNRLPSAVTPPVDNVQA